MKRILDDDFLATGSGAFIDTDWLTDNKVASVQERNCEICKHHVIDKRTQRHACEKWECNFERR